MNDYVYDYKEAPNRQVTLPTTVPLASLRIHLAEQEALSQAEAVKFEKARADYETAKAKAETEGTALPKAPVKAVPKRESLELVTPIPSAAKDPDLLRLVACLGEGAEEAFEQSGELVCQVAKERILEVLRLCRNDASLSYEMLSDETATHFPASPGFAFSVVYHLTSLSRAKRLRLRILIPEGFEPESAVQVYPAANWLEREVFDMLGIRFRNHPDLVRILCPDDWEDHPLRKEYPVTGWGQRDIDFRDDRSGVLERRAMEKAGNTGINLNVPKAE
jgi:NADH-quinone oxidoreductase subunit C